MSKVIIANWKNHPETPDEAMALARASDATGLVVAPPTKFLSIVARLLRDARLASQNFETKAEYTILGHSDYRAQGETDEAIVKKVVSALKLGVVPILCVGESRADHDSGRAKEFVASQLGKDLSPLLTFDLKLSTVLVAYEPIWSISTHPNATPDTPENANDMIQYIKGTLSKTFHLLPFTFYCLYGGSVNEANAESFLAQPAIEGLLVGAASLRAESIKKIIEMARRK